MVMVLIDQTESLIQPQTPGGVDAYSVAFQLHQRRTSGSGGWEFLRRERLMGSELLGLGVSTKRSGAEMWTGFGGEMDPTRLTRTG